MLAASALCKGLDFIRLRTSIKGVQLDYPVGKDVVAWKGTGTKPERMVQKKKALRKREEEEPVDLSFLEAEAASAAAGASADHGSRAQRGAIAEAQQAKREQDAATKQAR